MDQHVAHLHLRIIGWQPWPQLDRPIQLHGICDQQLVLLLGVPGDTWNVIHQRAVIWHMRFHVGVGPIRPPQNAVFKAINDGLIIGYDVVIGRTRCCQTLRSSYLGPDILVLGHQIYEPRKIRVIDPFLDVRPTHVVDYDDAGQLF